MKMRYPFLFLVLALCSAGNGCFDSSSPTGQTNPVSASSQTSSPDVQVWPPPAPPNLGVADNLLADNWETVEDASGSMGNSACGTGGNARMETAKSGTIAFVQKLPEEANIGLVVFSDRKRGGINEWIPLGSGPAHRAQFVQQVKSIESYGITPLRSAIKLGVQKLTEQAQKQRGYGTYHLVVVTDGEADNGEEPGAYVRELVLHTPIVVHAIGFCVDGRHSLDIPGYTQYSSASSPETLERAFRQVLAESASFTYTVSGH